MSAPVSSVRRWAPALDLAWIAEIAGADRASRGDRIQSLWSGYGELVRVNLEGGPHATAVVKWARPPEGRGRDDSAGGSVGDVRKRSSYQVEATWYREHAPRCPRARMPRLIGSRVAEDEVVLVLEDLDAAGFAGRRRGVHGEELQACLRWLAALHARFLGEPATGLWPTGTYWHLGTRRDELAAIEDPALRDAAPQLDTALESSSFRTLLHGDPKEANFCFGRDAAGVAVVAAVDFQYAGGGCGMKDLAYLLHGREDEPDDGIPRAHLATYFRHLRDELGRRADLPAPAHGPGAAAVDLDALEAEWRALYPIAKADFLRFLAGWAKDHWRRDARSQRFMRTIARWLPPF